ncbi:NAD-dependent epimerase/dehydratase family protein [Halostella sp. JP-L12]|uniref:NAD-dependent epimerase/dehydratase family protein n=1 Tax=Halostella TaxID=1843185 RepID=UPI000EF77437|nr:MULTISPECIES: NAD-dependent epimerase/dehydratase family protein [Halostella]NHN46444.1 NAD-dependent epimerase/dehydratase family protein [Halostella sp. JP-L12]
MVPPVRGRTILITGAAGFVGRHLVAALSDVNTVIALDHFQTSDPDTLPDDVIVLEGDIRDVSTLAAVADDVDLIFHQAVIGGAAARERPAVANEVNVTATLELLELARRQDARIVLPSSSAVYGDAETLPIPETAPTRPLTPYGTQKLAVDHYGRQWHELHGVETVVLRYFNVYGKTVGGDAIRGAVGAFLDQARDGRITVESDGSQVRDFVHVSDVVRANLLAATTDHTGQAFNVGTGSGTTIKNLARTVRDQTNPAATIEYAEPRRGHVQRSQADLSRARTVLGYEPTVELDTWLRRRVATTSGR